MTAPQPLVPGTDAENLPGVIAAHARGRGASELWTTAIGGAMNGVLLWSQFPGLHWLAAGFAAVSAYGTWGLVDRRMSILEYETAQPPNAWVLVAFVRALVGVAGCVAAAYAIATFMGAALGPLSLPGR
jgi:hypothetical protein